MMQIAQSSKPAPDPVIEALKLMSCDEVASLVEAAIREYASIGDWWKTMGGDISVLLVTKNGQRWIRNPPPPQKWSTVGELARDFLQGDVEMHVIPPYTDQDLKKLMSTVRLPPR